LTADPPRKPSWRKKWGNDIYGGGKQRGSPSEKATVNRGLRAGQGAGKETGGRPGCFFSKRGKKTWADSLGRKRAGVAGRGRGQGTGTRRENQPLAETFTCNAGFLNLETGCRGGGGKISSKPSTRTRQKRRYPRGKKILPEFHAEMKCSPEVKPETGQRFSR